MDALKTTELITQILKDESETYLQSSCITERPGAIFYPMSSDFYEYVKNHLNIKDTTHYKLQSQLYKNFKITADLVPDKDILTQNNLRNLRKNQKMTDFDFGTGLIRIVKLVIVL